MDIAKKLREVVTANFIEIVRSEEEQRNQQQQKRGDTPPASSARPGDVVRPAAVEATPEPAYASLHTDTPAAIAEAELKARRELDELEALLDSVQEEETAIALEAPPANVEEAEDEKPLEVVGDDLTPAEEPILAEEHAAEEPEAEPALAIEAVADRVEEQDEAAQLPEEMLFAEAPKAEEPAAAAAPDADQQPVEVIAKREAAVKPAPVISGPQDPLRYLNGDGTVDFARLLEDARLPAVAFGAEQAKKLLTALPEDLPMRVKRMTVKATLDAVSPNNPVDPQDIVADAMLKRFHMTQFRDALTEKLEASWRAHQAEIDRMEAEIERLRAEVAAHQERQRSGEAVCNQQVAQLEQVILFFQTDEALVQTPAGRANDTAEEDEIPPFMRDDSVYRLLGMNGDGGAEETAVPEGGESGRRGRRR